MRGIRERCAAAPAFVLALILLQRGVGTQGAMAAPGVGEVIPAPPDVPDFWPEVANDLRRVTWAHAVNSREKLDAALAGDVMMLEADVSIASDGETPIMAHPPSTNYDITLDEFLESVIKSTKKKGIKLDFKTTTAFQRAVPIIRQREARSEMRFPVWLNADVTVGPGSAAEPVSAPQFLALCKENFPGRTLSLGWTTGQRLSESDRYTEEHVHAMEEILNTTNVVAHHPITFAVRDVLAARSSQVLLPMLQARPVATLTVWGSAIDKETILIYVEDKARQIITSSWKKVKGIFSSVVKVVHRNQQSVVMVQYTVSRHHLLPSLWPDNEALVDLVKEAGFERVYLDLPKPVPGLTPDPTTSPAGTSQGSGAGGLAGVTWTPLLAATTLATWVATALGRF